MEERGLSIARTTIIRLIHHYGPQVGENVRHHLKPTNESWRVDETYIKIKDQWMPLYFRHPHNLLKNKRAKRLPCDIC